MIRALLTVLTFLSVIFFPWPMTAALALGSASFVPLLPVSVGIFADTLYYSPQAALVPLYTVFGAIVSVLVLFVRSRLGASSIG